MSYATTARSTSFGRRLAVTSGAIFFASSAIVIAALVWISTTAVADQMQDGLRAEAAQLLAKGDSALIAASIAASETSGSQRYLHRVADPNGRVLAGRLPASVNYFEGMQEVSWPQGLVTAGEAEEESREVLVTYGTATADGGTLIVGIDGENLVEAQEAVWSAAGWGLLIAAILGLAAAWAVSSKYQHRVDAVVENIASIEAAKLRARLPLDGSGDEIDRLAETVNRMLDRVAVAQEGLRQISSDVAHELRTPLSRLKQTLDYPDDGASPNASAVLDKARSEIDQILATFTALLRIAQLEGGLLGGLRQLDLGALLQRLVDAFGVVADESGHRLSAVLPPGIAIVGDPDLLLQLFANLVENAIRHTPSGTEIAIAIDVRSSLVVATVSDDGPGVPAEDLPKLARRFFRTVRSRAVPGTGLGMALASAIARAHGASFTVGANRPGLRIEVQFTLAGMPNLDTSEFQCPGGTI